VLGSQTITFSEVASGRYLPATAKGSVSNDPTSEASRPDRVRCVGLLESLRHCLPNSDGLFRKVPVNLLVILIDRGGKLGCS
jgi:hypothetical protein